MDQQTLTVIGSAISVATAIFWGSFWLGKIWARIEDHDNRIEALEVWSFTIRSSDK